MNKFLCVITVLLIILVYNYYQQYKIKQEYVKGFWSNEDEDLYILIADKKKNGRYGAYIVKSDSANEPFEIGMDIGICNTMKWTIKSTNALPKNTTVILDMAKSKLKIKMGKKYIELVKDSSISDKI